MSVPHIAQKIFGRLISNLAGVLLMTQECACVLFGAVWMHESLLLIKYVAILYLFAASSGGVNEETQTAPFCYCKPQHG